MMRQLGSPYSFVPPHASSLAVISAGVSRRGSSIARNSVSRMNFGHLEICGTPILAFNLLIPFEPYLANPARLPAQPQQKYHFHASLQNEAGLRRRDRESDAG